MAGSRSIVFFSILYSVRRTLNTMTQQQHSGLYYHCFNGFYLHNLGQVISHLKSFGAFLQQCNVDLFYPTLSFHRSYCSELRLDNQILWIFIFTQNSHIILEIKKERRQKQSFLNCLSQLFGYFCPLL